MKLQLIVLIFSVGKDVTDNSNKSGNTSKEVDRHHVEIHQATSRTSVFTSSTKVCRIILLINFILFYYLSNICI